MSRVGADVAADGDKKYVVTNNTAFHFITNAYRYCLIQARKKCLIPIRDISR